MRIDRKLNFVIPVETGDGTEVYVHATPIGAEVFRRYHLVIAKTFAMIHQEGLGAIAAPRVAAEMLREVARSMDETGARLADVEQGLLAEVSRLSNVLRPGPSGWEMVPLSEAIKDGTISPEDANEVENALAFFTVSSAMHRRAVLEPVLRGAAMLWGGRVESLSCAEFSRSLPTLTATERSGATAPTSSVPS